jgi:hypothetical protein
VPAVVVPVTVWALCCPFGEQGQFRPSVVDRWHAAVQRRRVAWELRGLPGEAEADRHYRLASDRLDWLRLQSQLADEWAVPWWRERMAEQHAGHLLPWSVLAGARCHDAPWPGRRYNACRLRFLLGEDAWHARRMPGPWP